MRRKIAVYKSFEDADSAEYLRRANQTMEQRLKEFEILQRRAFGDYYKKPIKKVVSYEMVKW